MGKVQKVEGEGVGTSAWLKPSSSSFCCPEGEEEGEGGALSSWEKVQVLALLLSLVTRQREAKGGAGSQGIPPG